MLDSGRGGDGGTVSLLRFVSPGRLILLATLVIASHLLISAGGSFMHSFRLAGDEASLRGEVASLSRDKQQLEQVRDYLRSDEYVEFMARRTFGLVKPGEKLVIVDAPKGVVETPAEPPGNTWWRRLFAIP